ncbi:MAG: sulfatase [Planctomycetota bacterium]
MAQQNELVPSARGRQGEWFRSWATLGLSLGTVLFVLRSSFLLLGFGRIPPASPELEAWHIALSMGRMLPASFGAAAIAAAIALSLRAGPAWAISALLSMAALSGWPLAAPGDLPDAATSAGRLSLAILGLTAIVLGALLTLAARRIVLTGGRQDPVRAASGEARPRPGSLPIALAVSAAVPLAIWLFHGRDAPHRHVRETAREILLDPSAWTVVSSLPDAAPRTGVLTPTLDWTVDGGDLDALVMPPPCEVRFTVGPDEDPLYLRASAGVDRRIAWQLQDAPEDCAVQFEIDVNGMRRFGAQILAREPASRRMWHHAGGRRGLYVEPGDTVTLRTSFSHPDTPIFGNIPIQAGFGRLELEREVARQYRRHGEEDPNVLLIVMDTQRADMLSCYGATEHKTPAFDALAERGILYERGYATSSWTWPSTASILTGLPPEAHGVLDEKACYLDGELETLAELLRDRDFSTGAFVCNPILDPAKNFDQGFETYDYSRDFRMSGAVVKDVSTWIDQHRDARFFLYLHLVDPHHPMVARDEDFARIGLARTPPAGSPEQPFIDYGRRLLEGRSIAEGGRMDPDPVIPGEHQRWMREAYRASVLSADHYVGEILRALEERGLDESTIVVFTSDHGEELLDHGLLGHGTTLYQELVRVPLILAGPGVPRGVRVETPVTNRSLFRTLATRCGAETRAVPDDVDLLSPASVVARPIYFTTHTGWWWNAPRTPIHGTLEWPWVIHVAPRGLAWGQPRDADPGDGQARLYHLVTDPEEVIDCTAGRADLSAAMRGRLAEHARSSLRVRSPGATGAGEATLDLLRRIGYTGEVK